MQVWYAYRSWATTIKGVRYLVIMSNFKCGEIKENTDLVHNNVVTSLVVWCLNRAFDRLWAFRIYFLEIRTGFSTKTTGFSTIDQVSAKCRRNVGEVSVNEKLYRPRHIWNDYRPCLDRLSTDYRPLCRPTVDRVSTEYRPSVDRVIFSKTHVWLNVNSINLQTFIIIIIIINNNNNIITMIIIITIYLTTFLLKRGCLV